MFIELDDFKYRVASEENVLKAEEDEILEAIENRTLEFREHKKHRIPLVMREIIGVTANISKEKRTEIAESFGVTPVSVTNFKQGRVDRLGDERLGNKILKDGIEEQLGRVRNKAIDRIVATLDCMTAEKLEDAGLGTLSKVASDLSSVIKATLPKEEKSPVNNNQFNTVFYSPKSKTEEEFPTIEV